MGYALATAVATMASNGSKKRDNESAVSLDFFTEASRIDDHPKDRPVFRDNRPLIGVTEIRRTLEREMNLAATVDAYTISNVEVSGNTVTWDHSLTESDGGRTCAEGEVKGAEVAEKAKRKETLRSCRICWG